MRWLLPRLRLSTGAKVSGLSRNRNRNMSNDTQAFAAELFAGMGETLNVMVLLGVVIVLGMLVDDAVVVVEGIYYRVRHGMHAMPAAIEALKEVAAPVTAAVFTTIAAFGPLILLPGILGDFMRVVPMVGAIICPVTTSQLPIRHNVP